MDDRIVSTLVERNCRRQQLLDRIARQLGPRPTAPGRGSDQAVLPDAPPEPR
ncbi:hypothetical protein AB0J52_00325 [Spirillospora sp. NPDC049652]